MEDRKDLKIQAYKERLSEIVVGYEERDAERRVYITELTNLVSQLSDEIKSLKDKYETETNQEPTNSEDA